MLLWYIIEIGFVLYVLSHIKTTLIIITLGFVILIIYGILLVVFPDFMCALTKSVCWSLILYPLVLEFDYESETHIIYNLFFAPFIRQFGPGGLLQNDVLWNSIFPNWVQYVNKYPDDLINYFYCWNPPFFEFVFFTALVIYGFIKLASRRQKQHCQNYVQQPYVQQSIASQNNRVIGFAMPESTISETEKKKA